MDRRDYFGRYGSLLPLETSIDSVRMILSVPLEDEDGEESIHEIPFIYEVCGTCRGRGSHVNPSIDADGISSQEFHEDPDFAETYFSGGYDVSCFECHGLRVVPTLPEEDPTLTAEQRKGIELLLDWCKSEREYRQQCEMERRHGC